MVGRRKLQAANLRLVSPANEVMPEVRPRQHLLLKSVRKQAATDNKTASEKKVPEEFPRGAEARGEPGVLMARKRQKMMDQGSVEVVCDVIVPKMVSEKGFSRPQESVERRKKEQVPCGLCGRWCGPFARLGALRLRRKSHQHFRGARSDSEQRNRSRSSPIISC